MGGGPAARAPDQLTNFYHTVLTFECLNACSVGFNVTTTKRSSTFWGKNAPREKIQDTRMRKKPSLTLVWGPEWLIRPWNWRIIFFDIDSMLLFHYFIYYILIYRAALNTCRLIASKECYGYRVLVSLLIEFSVCERFRINHAVSWWAVQKYVCFSVCSPHRKSFFISPKHTVISVSIHGSECWCTQKRNERKYFSRNVLAWGKMGWQARRVTKFIHTPMVATNRDDSSNYQ